LEKKSEILEYKGFSAKIAATRVALKALKTGKFS